MFGCLVCRQFTPIKSFSFKQWRNDEWFSSCASLKSCLLVTSSGKPLRHVTLWRHVAMSILELLYRFSSMAGVDICDYWLTIFRTNITAYRPVQLKKNHFYIFNPQQELHLWPPRQLLTAPCHITWAPECHTLKSCTVSVSTGQKMSA